MIGDLRPETVKFLHPMPRARHTDLIARRNEDVRTLAISPRGKAAGDEKMHKDAAGDDRGPERQWHNGLGCAVMVAAMYLVREIWHAAPKIPVRLFE